MAAAATDLLQEVGINTATTLDAPGYTIGGTSLTVVSTSNMPTATGITIAMDEIDANGDQVAGSYNEYVGVVTSATAITSLSHQNGTDRDYDAGTTTRVYLPVSAERENRIVEWGTEEHNQNGTHSDITATTLSLTQNIDVADGKGVRDGNNNELLVFQETASAVNELEITNAATGNAPQLAATGGDSNIDIKIVPKGTGAVTNGTQKIDWWQELGRTTLGSAGDTITVSSLPVRKYLKILVWTPNSASIQQRIVFNNDTGSNYVRTSNSGGGADTTATSTASQVISGATSNPVFSELYVINVAAQEKIHHWECNERSTAGAANPPVRREGLGKWVNTTDAITRVDVLNASTGDFDVGSEVVVLGHD